METPKEFKVTRVSDLWDKPIPTRQRRGEAPIVYVDTEVKNRAEELSTVWWSGRQWAVTEYGIERRDGTYAIQASRLAENLPDYSWPEHMGGKTWIDIDDFITAWLIAIALHGDPDAKPAHVKEAIQRSHPPRTGPGEALPGDEERLEALANLAQVTFRQRIRDSEGFTGKAPPLQPWDRLASQDRAAWREVVLAVIGAEHGQQ